MNSSKTLLGWVVLLPCILLILSGGVQAAQNCIHCHTDRQQGFSTAHAAFARDCTRCHAGDATATVESAAHHGLIAFPGDLANAPQVCGGCHADKVDSVTHSLMHTGAGMIATTRQVFDESIDRPGHNDLAHLTHSPADSLLRKRCASCHLGQHKTAHRLDSVRDRGGGCLACHINDYPQTEHPALTVQVDDGRCFGCHSRSSRISLSYAGLAEVDSSDKASAVSAIGQLPDGRHVESRPDDLHHAAGMSCIDCHTGNELMGVGTGAATTEQQAVDISCRDCHDITRTISLARWPDKYRPLRSYIPFDTNANTRFPVTARGTPLWHIELRGTTAWLHRKDKQGRLRIPPYREHSHPLAAQHARLSCSACHAGWAPQCYGCHLDYNAKGRQFDHVTGLTTAGRWNGRRSNVRNGLPPLGVTAANRVVPVVPGMIMTVVHPDWPAPHFVRRFAAIEPHTTATSRSCLSCHRTPSALGLGQGQLQYSDHSVTFRPDQDRLDDELAADAWTRLEKTPYRTTTTVHPFSSQEIKRILAVPLP